MTTHFKPAFKVSVNSRFTIERKLLTWNKIHNVFCFAVQNSSHAITYNLIWWSFAIFLFFSQNLLVSEFIHKLDLKGSVKGAVVWRLLQNSNRYRGHSNNTWHFFGTFLTTLCDIFQFCDDWFLGLNCFEIFNEIEVN
jgi:hypothetical protein